MDQLYKIVIRGVGLLLALLMVETTLAQEKQETVIKGKLTDEQNGDPIIGAIVFIKDTKIGGQTDVDGNFEIKTTQEPPFTLTVTYVGYQTKEIEVFEVEDVVDFKLRTQQLMDEVVVVGYGEQKRSDLTGSVSSVPKELKSQPVASVERLLQGSVAGAVVTQTSGQPGGGVSVQIRGNNSITAGSDPLYVVDGFPLNNDYGLNDATVTNGSKINPLSTLNTTDIESIDVLKDASATAIYGSRGANGVVIVTTKKAKKGESAITYDAYYGQQRVIRTLPLLNAGEWWQLRKDAAANSGRSDVLRSNNQNLLNQANANGYTLDTAGVGTDWQKEAFRVAPIQSHSLSILTGGEKTSVALSGNYFNQQGVLQNTDFVRYSSRLNIDHDYNKRLKLASSIVGSYTKANVAPEAIVGNLLFTPPSLPVYKNDGSFLLSSPFENALQNPINSLYNQLNDTRTNRFLGNASADYKILDGLSVKVLLGADVVDNKQNRYLPSATFEGLQLGGQATVGSAFTTNWLNENTVNYTRKIGRAHHINSVAGYAVQVSNTEATIADANGFAFDELTVNSLGDATTARSPRSFTTRWQLASYLGRINYVLLDKYLFTFTVRADGSSRFGENNKWGTFPSVALGWNLHKEDFFSSFKNLSNLKLRLSAGNTGNQAIPPYSSLSRLTAYRYNFSNNTVVGYASSAAANPQLGWEKTFQVDFGVDLGLFNNRVSIIADYYYKRTSDLLLNAPVSGTSGFANYDVNNSGYQASTIYQNLGVVENKGFEFALSTQNIVGKKFNWNTVFIYSVNRNKVLELGPGVTEFIPNISNPSIVKVGYAVGSFIVYETDGLIQPGEDGVNALTPQAQKVAGGQKYKDQNGDGKITQAEDRIVINNQPGFVAGLTNTFSYKTAGGTLDLTVFFQTQVGGKIYNQNRASLELATGYINGSAELRHRYSSTNTNTDVKAPFQDPAITISDRFIEDASYLRLKNFTVGYSLPESLLKKARIKAVRFYISLQNYLTFTNYSGYDPEVSFTGQSLIDKGIDRGVYPNSKSAQIGGSITF